MILLSLLTIGAFAQTTIMQPGSTPVNPILAGQGGSFTANAKGYNSLFKNPAAFAMDGGDFTLLSANLWSFADQSMVDFATKPGGVAEYYKNIGATITESVTPDKIQSWAQNTSPQQLIDMASNAGLDTSGLSANDPSSVQAFIQAQGLDTLAQNIASSSDPAAAIASADPAVLNLASSVIKDMTGGKVDLLPSGNFRLGANIGLLGVVGEGFGVGLNVNADASLRGQTLLDSKGYAAVTATLTAGYAVELIEEFLYIGADVRPLYRVFLPVSGQQALDIASDFSNMMKTINSYSIYAGWGIGIDAGAIMKIGDLHIGATVTDILGTKINYSSTDVGSFLSAVQSFQLPTGTLVNDNYVIPMDVLIGVSYTLNFDEGSYLDVHGEVSNALRGIAAIQHGEKDFDYLALIHAGANLTLWDFLSIMGGYNEGYISGGLGLDLWFVELNATGFLKANPANVGYTDFGATVEFAIRFD